MTLTKEQKHEYYLKHKAEILAKSKKWKETHKERYRQLQRERQIKRWQTAPEQQAEYQRRYRKNNLDKINARLRERYANDDIFRMKRQQMGYDRRERKKAELMTLLGGIKCARCGFADVRALQFEHKNGGGTAEYLRIGGHEMTMNYYLAHSEEAKQTLQVYCANCNWIKKHERAEIHRGKTFQVR